MESTIIRGETITAENPHIYKGASPKMPEPKLIYSPQIKAGKDGIYEYEFGLDMVTFKSSQVNNTCGEIFQDIPTHGAEFLELEVKEHETGNGSIEYYIIDEDKEVPIMPVGKELIRREKIFFGMVPRFEVDPSYPYEIRENGVIVDASLDHILKAGDASYTITYKPKEGKRYTTSNSKVALKVIIRKYDNTGEMPFIESIILRAHKGGSLWTDRPVLK